MLCDYKFVSLVAPLKIYRSLLVLVSIAFVSESVAQQSSSGHQLEEVLVSATKRDASVRDIAGSVGAVGGEQLERLKAQGLDDYLKLVPGVTLSEAGADQSVPVIRGITTTTTTGGFTALSVGIYLDDMPFQDLFAPFSIPDLNPFDLERVEVLKGPQGTLFGSGALAGAIRYIPRKPIPGEWGAKLQYTDMDTEEGSPSRTKAMMVNVPLGDNAALRGLTLDRTYGGIYDVRAEDGNGNVVRNEEDVDRFDQDTYRLMAAWDVTENISLSAMAFEQETEQYDAFSYANQDQEPKRDDQPVRSPRESSFGGLNLGATWSLPWFDVLYSGNKLEKDTFSNTQQAAALGLGNQDDIIAPNILVGDVDGTTSEIRFSSPADSDGNWRWLAGISKLEYEQFIFQFFTVKSNDGSPPPRQPSDVNDIEKITSQLYATIDGQAEETAYFGEVTGLLFQEWELTLGLRKYETDLISDTALSGAQIVALSGETETRNRFDIDSDGLNPKVSLRWLFNDQIQFYAMGAKGFQFGGVQLNPPLDIFTAAAEQNGYQFAPYDSSTLWNYEIGVRSEWFDRRLRADLSVFYMDWKDLQLTVTVPVSEETLLTPSIGYGLIANVGAAHSQGAELSIEALPYAWLRLFSGVSYLEAQTDEPFDEDSDEGPVPAGTALPGAPRWQASNQVSLDFTIPFTQNWFTSLSLTHTYMGPASNAIRQQETVGGYNTFDALATLSYRGHRLTPTVTVALTNITDERAVSTYEEALSLDNYAFIQPKTLSISLELEY